MPHSTLTQGLLRIPEYNALAMSAPFLEIQEFSDDFARTNLSRLRSYGARWVNNPFHQWSRRWEYPFVFLELDKFLKTNSQQRAVVLDAGSGITFFPFYLTHKFSKLAVRCVDMDESLATPYREIAGQYRSNIEFVSANIANIDAPTASFDAIYCISVLEHTKNYGDIVREFNRLLRPGGRLLLTFDISLDGNADVPIAEAKHLLATLCRTFKATDESPISAMTRLNPYFDSDVLTTDFVRRHDPSLLPWKFPRLSGALASISKGRLPRFAMKKLACSCHVFEKLA